MAAKPFIRTLRAQWLGQQLRELREDRGLTLRLVAEHLQRDLSALGRYERAEWPIRRGDVVALLDLYGFHNAAERSRLLTLAEEVWRTDRWDEDFGDVVDASFIDFPWLESRAERVCSYYAMLVPGLLQTRAYAEAVMRVLPAAVGLHAGLDGTFLVFRMPTPYPAVAYVEYLGGRLHLESPKSERYVRAYDRLREAALGTSESAELIATIVEEL